MLLAAVEFSNEVVIAGAVSLGGIIGVLFKLLMSASEARVKAAESLAASYKEISDEAMSHLQVLANRLPKGKGNKQIPPPLKPVVPEHNSPTTKEQQTAAELQTDRAKLTALTLALDLPPRPAAPMEESSKGAKAIAAKAEEITAKAEEITDEAKKISDQGAR